MKKLRDKFGTAVIAAFIAGFVLLIALGVYVLAERSMYTSMMFEMSCSVSYSNGNRGALASTDGGDWVKLDPDNLTSIYNMIHTAGFAGRGREWNRDDGIVIYFDDGCVLYVYRNGTDDIYVTFVSDKHTRSFKTGFGLKYGVLEQLSSMDGVSIPNSPAKYIPEGVPEL